MDTYGVGLKLTAAPPGAPKLMVMFMFSDQLNWLFSCSALMSDGRSDEAKTIEVGTNSANQANICAASAICNWSIDWIMSYFGFDL